MGRRFARGGVLCVDGGGSTATSLMTSVDQAEPGTPRLSVAGEIDLANVAEFDAALDGVLAGGTSAVVDLTEVTHFGSTAIGALIGAHALAGERAVRLVIRPSAIVRRVREVTRLDTTFGLADMGA